jgi:hypothetical protein
VGNTRGTPLGVPDHIADVVRYQVNDPEALTGISSGEVRSADHENRLPARMGTRTGTAPLRAVADKLESVEKAGPLRSGLIGRNDLESGARRYRIHGSDV